MISGSDERTLCAASAYDKKYYFNPHFDKLPSNIKKELQIMCVIFTEECGGLISLEFDEEGNLLVRTSADEEDITYDEISAGLLVHEMQKEKFELFEALEKFYKVFFIGIDKC